MSRARRRRRTEMGEAISFEDVLTVITVLLLLRLVFMVPLVNLDKAKTISARRDAFWPRQAAWTLSHPGETGAISKYRTAFDLQAKTTSLTFLASENTHGSGNPLVADNSLVMGNSLVAGNSLYLEAAAADSNLMVIKHDLLDSSFIAMQVHGRGHSLSFRRGKLLWSQGESEWFPASDTIDYGTHPQSKAMEKEFREWTRKTRGY